MRERRLDVKRGDTNSERWTGWYRRRERNLPDSILGSSDHRSAESGMKAGPVRSTMTKRPWGHLHPQANASFVSAETVLTNRRTDRRRRNRVSHGSRSRREQHAAVRTVRSDAIDRTTGEVSAGVQSSRVGTGDAGSLATIGRKKHNRLVGGRRRTPISPTRCSQ